MKATLVLVYALMDLNKKTILMYCMSAFAKGIVIKGNLKYKNGTKKSGYPGPFQRNTKFLGE
jgi:hypothetical protein